MSHNRMHIPIITHPDVTFQVGRDVKHLKPGEIWEINNNKKLHGVNNKSNIDRIHMLIDWKPL
jgi:quercetin dioxygenase-like cupin family protein